MLLEKNRVKWPEKAVKALGSILILLSTFNCRSPKSDVNEEHEQYVSNLVETDLKRVPDSLKHWTYKFKEILLSDQRYRKSSEIFSKNVDKQTAIDLGNEKIIMEYVQKYGYPELNKSCVLGILAVQSTMNHASLATKQEFYPYIIDAYKKGIVTYELSTFEDKLNLQLKRKQNYGTQVYVNSTGEYMLAPVYRIDSMNSYRKEAGLDPIDDYLKQSFNVEWDIRLYKSREDSLIKVMNLNDSVPLRFVKN